MLYKLDRNIKGIAALFFAYFIWGAMPIYWKALEAISSFEILGHRVIWSAFFTFILNNGLTNILLAGTGILTSIPLILFAFGAARVPLTTIGFVQYISPTLSFILGVFVYNEPILMSRIITFIFIWAALAVYSTDAIIKSRRRVNSNKT
ncbi:MAG: EamA family transporter [Synergistaceae bacterium]